MDNLTSAQRKKTMQAVRSNDTRAEVTVRRLVHSMGFRYRLHVRALPGCPDLVFSKRRKLIFVHGCFWHGHDCSAGLNVPKSRRDYWIPKLDRNKRRDATVEAILRDQGWTTLTIWECQLRDIIGLRRKITNFLHDKETETVRVL